MLHELIYFLLFRGILLCHSAHELLHSCDIGFGNRLCFIATGFLPCDIYDTLAAARCGNSPFAIEKHCRSNNQHYASCRRGTPKPDCALVFLSRDGADSLAQRQ